MWCVYILKGTRYYVGSTNDLERRLDEHRKGLCYTTKRIGEWKLVKQIPCDGEDTARKLEKEIKKKGHYDRLVDEN